ncbi:MAG: hypothetical protein CM15mP73_1710 [Hyphomicrobiales bacterium]|nr:MAG: hypothetical protein CM15mP73_1710 [Hyphomicrobiales bacterium]
MPEGKEISKKTWNERLGIINGISILGKTQSIVIPFSCSLGFTQYIAALMCNQNKYMHIAACRLSLWENSKKEYNLPPQTMIDMGDFLGGMLKYLKKILCQKLQSQEALQNF